MRPTEFRPLDDTERLMRSTPVMWFYDGLMRAIGYRDRLRCPRCHAVGTFKPHGTIFDTEDKRHEHRWLCKWCGYYLGPEGACTAVIDPAIGVWALPDTDLDGWTPRDAYAISPLGRVAWPWRG